MVNINLPNFLVIGAAKAGTTALHHYLRQHPDIFMSTVKEPMYFAFVDNPPNSQGPGDYVQTAVYEWDAYTELFSSATEQMIGECSPIYLYDDGCAVQIRKTIPTAKLIVILRNPVERAWSAYLHKRRNGVEVYDNFMQAMAAEPTRISSGWGPLWHYKKMGLYADQLEQYFEQFPREQIGIWLHDQFRQDAIGVTQEMFRFLGVNDTFEPNTSLQMNVSGRAKNARLHHLYNWLFGQPNLIKTISHRVIPQPMRLHVTTQLRNQNMERVEMPAEARTHLIDFYHADMMRLQQLIEEDISHWMH